MHRQSVRHHLRRPVPEEGQRTELFARFSTVAGGAGSADTPRDVRGFAVKFYTRQGNWDLVGKMVLDRYPDHYFAESEQMAFCPSHLVPGINHSNDPLLQDRLFSYQDTQLSRLGTPNWHEIPINQAKGREDARS